MLLPDEFVQTPWPHPHGQRSGSVVDIGQAAAPTNGGRRTWQIEQTFTHALSLTNRTDTRIRRGQACSAWSTNRRGPKTK